jgi:glycerol-3-phosphate dehydrogenase
MPESAAPFDLLVVGGGINGVGIARDAAGRGLKVLLCERDDLASGEHRRGATKLIHGGLALPRALRVPAGRRVARRARSCCASRAHLVEPLSFVLPHEPHLRPA